MMTILKQHRDIGSLPNEILINILSLFSTRSLLSLTRTSRRIHDVILRIIHYRLLAAANVPGHKIILECYLPSAKYTTPYFTCDFQGTDAVADDDLEGVGSLGKLRGLYSHFRPTQPEGDRKVWRVAANGNWLPSTIDQFTERKEDYVSQEIDMESYESFSQLQSSISMVKVSPRKDYFLSKVTINEGLTRVWKHWLLECAQCTTPTQLSAEDHTKKLLWSSLHEHAGLRFMVNKRTQSGALPGLRVEEDTVSYTLQYEELVIRTSQILLSVEHALEQEAQHKGESCGLDGVFVQERYLGGRVENSTGMVWRSLVHAL